MRTSLVSQQSRWIDVALASGIMFVTGAIFLPFVTIGVELLHDGALFKPALDVSRGATLFKDTFQHYGALTAYIQAFFLGAFGPTLKVLKMSTLCFYLLSAGTLFMLWRTFLNRGLALASVVIWIMYASIYRDYATGPFKPWSSVYAIPFQALSLMFLLRALQSSKSSHATAHLFFSGVFTAAVFWVRSNVGVYHAGAMLVAFGIVFLPDKKTFSKKALCFIGGMALLHIVFFSHLYFSGSLGDWHEQIIQWGREIARAALQNISDFQIMIAVVVGTFEIDAWGWKAWLLLAAILLPLRMVRGRGTSAWILLAVGYGFALIGMFPYFPEWVRYPLEAPLREGLKTSFPLLMLIATIGWLISLFRTKGFGLSERMVLAVIVVSLASFLQYMPVQNCDHHKFWAMAISIGPFVYLASQLTQDKGWPLLAALFVIMWPTLHTDIRFGYRKLTDPYVTLDRPRILAGMRVTPKEALAWKAIDDVIEPYYRAHPSGTGLLLGGDEILAALAPHHRNAVSIYNYAPSEVRVNWHPDDDQKRVQFIRETKPVIFLQVHDARTKGILEAVRDLNYKVVTTVPSFTPFSGWIEILLPHSS
ncbi:MAG: hypothetical protein HY537_01600 [Deltaproteobacteria bacterium]|nr:hypothetical protein [Deltaproteobacteria bacterium]